ncbi:MarR family transcriptional regulator for hemolysin [Paraburkholderia sp. RAU2J]|uniref:MarR family winged helix-turn-helix transcriptional regulator n=1 Tax=Paraburkholderia sp. RAU2J TaxID=1938810 RepID=UPI000EAE94AE|nr:MarR family transcriptional regulator [Paraburkholderia sp. RAU2J]RKT20721.1 MarR family transcriptional regulator for hemolysin [Paraburkholderia sp. RAU2J]
MPNLDILRRTVSSTLVVAARKWRRTSHGVLAAFNVSEACATPLLTASRLGAAVRQVTLADHVGIEGPSLVRLLDQLCAAGLMRREEDPEDRRAKTVALTDEGRAVTAKMEEELVTLRAQALKGVSRSDLEAALRVLDAFTNDAAERVEQSGSERARLGQPTQQARRTQAAQASQQAQRAQQKQRTQQPQQTPAKLPPAARKTRKTRKAAKAPKSNKGKADAAAPHHAGDPA